MGETILYADDEPRYLRLVRLFLEREGYEVLTAENGQEALDALGRRPDTALLILDVMMPVKDGFETCRCLRSFSKLPILMLTALGDEGHEIRGIEGGADDYLSKPFSRDLLLAHVRALLRRGRAELLEMLVRGGITVDTLGRVASVDSQPVELSFREFELLLYLMRNAGAVVLRERLLLEPWYVSVVRGDF